MHKRLLLGLAIGWVVVVAVILVWTWQSGQSLIRQVNNAHLDYEARLIAADIEQEVALRINVLQRLADTLARLSPTIPRRYAANCVKAMRCWRCSMAWSWPAPRDK